MEDRRNLVISGLDFSNIKSNLIEFLRSQEKFKDYNFEGSSLSVLMDLLAYNTHYNSFYANMAVNESFLDSCSFRSSAVSLAKQIGYVPRSRQGASITVDVRITSRLTDSLRLEYQNRNLKVRKFDIFKAANAQKTILFYATETKDFEIEINSSGNEELWARNVTLVQGVPKTKTFVYDSKLKNQNFILNEKNVDSRSIEVNVQRSRNSSEGISDIWYRETDINLIGPESNVYFVQEVYNDYYEIYFGDGIIGRRLDNGNLINVFYSVCEGENGNLIGKNDSLTTPTFSYVSSQNLSVTYAVQVKRDEQNRPIASYGGSEIESLDSIKFYAPKYYQAQDRAVTVNDYISYLSGLNSDYFKSIYVWGGEENDPPEYGKVFVSIKPRDEERLSTLEKLNIEKNILRSKSIVAVTPKVVDPNYLYIIPRVRVLYREQELDIGLESLRSAILDLIVRFNENNLSVFNKNFYSSDLTRKIIDVHPAIKSCSINLTLKKKLIISPSVKTTYNVKFDNELMQFENSTNYFYTSSFKTDNIFETSFEEVFARDDGNGKIVTVNSVAENIVRSNQGSVVYSNGNITLKDIKIYPSEVGLDTTVLFYAKPKEQEILSRRNTILSLEVNSSNLILSRT